MSRIVRGLPAVHRWAFLQRGIKKKPVICQKIHLLVRLQERLIAEPPWRSTHLLATLIPLAAICFHIIFCKAFQCLSFVLHYLDVLCMCQGRSSSYRGRECEANRINKAACSAVTALLMCLECAVLTVCSAGACCYFDQEGLCISVACFLTSAHFTAFFCVLLCCPCSLIIPYSDIIFCVSWGAGVYVQHFILT